MHALALMAAGDTDGYRQICARLLERFGQTEDRATTNHMAWTSVLGPANAADVDRCVQLMEKLVGREPIYPFLSTLGAALYRAGRFDAAIQRLNETHKTHGDVGTNKSWLFLAMAQHRLGRTEEARRSLDKVVSWQDGVDRFEYQVLRREAEELLKGEKP